jgi:hypothetical protein
MSKPKSALPESVSLTDLRMLLGDVTVSHVNHLERQGVIEKAERGMYTIASVGAYVRWLRKVQAGPEDWRSVRTQIGHERLALLRLERGQRERELLPKADVKRVNVGIMATIKARLLATPASLAVRLIELHHPQEAEAIVREGIVDALQELSALADVAEPPRRRRNGHADRPH